jgi:hypothetical protein
VTDESAAALDRSIAALASPDADRRCAVLEALAHAPLAAAAVPAVVACLATPAKRVQRLAADLLRDVPADLRPDVIAGLRAAIVSADSEWRFGAAWALGRLGVVELAMLAPLVEALGALDGDRRWAAAELLTTCARVHADRVEAALLDAVHDAVAERRKMALYVLRDVAPTSPAVRDATTRALGDPAVGVRFAALAALVRLEPVPPDACTLVLARARNDSDAGLRRAALTVLGEIGRGIDEAERAVAAAESSDDPATRRAAAIARRRLGA